MEYFLSCCLPFSEEQFVVKFFSEATYPLRYCDIEALNINFEHTFQMLCPVCTALVDDVSALTKTGMSRNIALNLIARMKHNYFVEFFA
jgi:hypothetical protein